MTKWQLFAALTSRALDKPPLLTLPNGQSGYLSSIFREDGSGSSFVLTLVTPSGNHFNTYIRTTD